MDNTRNHIRKLNPKQKSNIVSRLFFCYTFKLLKHGFWRDIKNEDIYEILPELKSEKLKTRLEKEWDKKKYKKNPSLYVLLWNLFGWNYVLLNMTQIINAAIGSVANPLLIGLLISYFVPGQTELNKTNAVLYGCLLIFLNFIRVLYMQNFRLALVVLTMKMQAALGTYIYKRVLHMKSPQLNKVDVGRYTTIIENDLTELTLSIQHIFLIWGDIMKVIFVIFVMHKKIGFYASILIITLPIVILAYVYVLKKIFLLIRKRSAKTDERITITKRIVTSIRTIKMCTYESYFYELVSKARKDEVKTGSGALGLSFINKCFGTLFYQLCVYFIITTYVEFGENVDAKDIYFVVSSLQSISNAIISTIPICMYYFNYILNALQRISVVFENPTSFETAQEIQKCLQEPKLILKNVSLSIHESIIFTNSILNIEKGLNLLTGPVGSGKSMLLKLILGDFELTEGSIICEGRISYASQEPWLFPSTVRQNIVFTEKYNEDRYYQVVRSCGLLHDFTFWEKGDQTIVAENGINLSKGQQSRINLARALYREAEIYLIDDCFSVLDNIVADFVFKECILTFLKNNIVVLVSDKTNFIAYASKEIKINKDNLTCLSVTCDNANFESTRIVDELENIGCVNQESLILDENADHEGVAMLKSLEQVKKIYDEEKESKAVPWKIYYKYFEFGGGCVLSLAVISAYLILQGLNTYNYKLLSSWSNLEQKMVNYTSHNGTKADKEYLEIHNQRMHIIYIYAGTVFGIILSLVVQALAIVIFTRRVSFRLHKYLISKIMSAQLSFFSDNFLGNILNRLYQDMLFMDRTVPVHLHLILKVILELIGAVVLVIYVNFMFLIPTGCFIVALYLLRICYLRTGFNLKRLACSNKSALVGYMASTLDGLTTIQVSKGGKTLQKEFEQFQDLATSASYMHESCRTAFTFAGDLFSCVFIACIVLKFLLVDSATSVGNVGLAVTQSFIIAAQVNLCIMEWVNFDTSMTSLERLLEYTKTKQESREGLIIEDWPKAGEIKFENVSLSYSNSKIYTLRNLNFVINAGERVGIVGRTGSGKSSIVSALFRLYEVEGRILIDNIDIKTLSLDLLRQQIAVIPQDPFVFPGTIRENIDPLKKYPDEKIYKAMEISKLNQFIPNLEFRIKQGTNLSLGQKQLICLARVLLRDTKIVIFDEAAENVDEELGLLLKNIVTDNINNCTIITVAHKLDFVMTCDKIVLIHDGEVSEIGSPNVLLKDVNSTFYKMSKKAG